MLLRNLNHLANESRNRYLTEYINEDRKLSQQFKDAYSRIANNGVTTIRFLDYSAELKNVKTIFLPNQWFFIAAYMAEYVSELIKYKIALEEIFSSKNTGTSKDKLPAFKNQTLNSVFLNAISDYFQGETEQVDFMSKFITEYDWWNGSKTIDRHDFYLSPVLSLLGVVAVSQSYIADIASLYANNSVLKTEAIALIDQLPSNPVANLSVSAPGIAAVTGGKNLIVYGAPGTGKSHFLENNSTVLKENVTRITFHPEYTYYDFIGSYKPVTIYRKIDGTFSEEPMGEPLIDYKFIPGPFTLALENALEKTGEMHMLLIEEINRANAAAVFGDLFQLLDRNDAGESVYRIKSDSHILKYLKRREIFIPSNLHLFATMNSADQGVYVLDSAFKRRWNFMYMPIQFTASTKHFDELVSYEGSHVPWWRFVTAINKKLGQLNINEDKHIGPYFMKPGEPSKPENIASKLLIYLWDDVVRYHRKEFFAPVTTFAELVQKYYDDGDIIPSLELNDGRVVDDSDDEE
ncbi:AAA family ATPase [Paenibacillus sp. Soil787]|uniref:AAA family ATPase n=1 Tax=Paenibacillus sp. Soil787 TaxID=1736411 RepID=UPI0006FF7072|nr:AAA family ATPase [Paenibacillus sp. Soil787]KRF39829.1 hypothetical protein ASG93_22975 [Paenibacillus sp. Soil787]